MAQKVYIPESDCDCYFQAVDLLNEILQPLTDRMTNLENQFPTYSGMSTDDKPSDAEKNAIFFEVDTGKFYYFDGDAWHEISCGDCGGGGSFNLIYADCEGDIEEDFDEYKARIENGETIYLFYLTYLYRSTGRIWSDEYDEYIEFAFRDTLINWRKQYNYITPHVAPKIVTPVTVGAKNIDPQYTYYLPYQWPGAHYEYVGNVNVVGNQIYTSDLETYVENYCSLVFLIYPVKKTYTLLDSNNDPVSVDVLEDVIYQYMANYVEDVTVYPWDSTLQDYDMNSPIEMRALIGGNFKIVFTPWGTQIFEIVANA